MSTCLLMHRETVKGSNFFFQSSRPRGRLQAEEVLTRVSTFGVPELIMMSHLDNSEQTEHSVVG
jgi:hypothetical protein